MRGERLFNALAHLFGLFGFRFGQNRILSFASHKSGDDASVAISDDGIAFPVADTGFFIDDRWKLIDADTVGDASPMILFAVTFASFFWQLRC